MKTILLSYVYSFMRLLVLTVLITTCGSTVTINGYKVKDGRSKPIAKTYVGLSVISFGFGGYLEDNNLNRKR